MMIEGRAVIESIEKAKAAVESLGYQFKNDYAFTDVIYVPKKPEYNLSEDFLRMRVYVRTNWPTKNVVLARKKTQFKETGKVDHVVLKAEFDTAEEVSAYIERTFPKEFERGFDYYREGWEYHLGQRRIFVEDIRGWVPSVEVEAEDEAHLKRLFDQIGIVEVVRDSVPEVMRRLLKASDDGPLQRTFIPVK